MSTYDVTIVERITYTTTVEAGSEEEAMEIASQELVESDGPESAFGSPDYGDTEVESATRRTPISDTLAASADAINRAERVAGLQ